MEGAAGGDFAELQDAHHRVARLYTEVHRKYDRRFRLRAVIDDHLRRGTRLLRREYIQASETTFTSESEREWLDREIDRLENLESTFDRRWVSPGTPGTIQTAVGFPGVKFIIGATGLSAAGLAVSGNCLCHLLGIVPGIITLTLCTVALACFDPARERLEENGVFAAEEEVFTLLDTGERPELQYWSTLLTVIAAIWLAAATLEALAIRHHSFTNPRAGYFWLYAGAFTLIAVISQVMARRGRRPSGEASVRPAR